MDTGYDVPFVTEIEPRFQCPICLLVLREPMQTACGHRFCEPCIRRVIVTNHVLTCPVDKQYSRVNQMFPDVAIRREILSLLLQCPNTQDGCCWRGELRELEKHREMCHMEEVQCPHGCELMTKRSLLDEHAIVCPSRQVKCKHCQEQVIHRDLDDHTDKCPKALVKCELCGVGSLRRDELSGHQHPETGNCEKVLVDCPYSVFGCSYKAERSKMEFHSNCNDVLKEHMDLARSCLSEHKQTITELKDTVKTLVQKTEELLPMIQQNQQKYTQMSRSLSERNVTGRIHWKVKLNNHHRQQRGVIKSQMFYTGCPGYKVQLGLDLDGHRENNNRYIGLDVSLLAGEYDDQVIFPFNATCLVTMYDLFNTGARRNFTTSIVVREAPRVMPPGRNGDRIYRRGLNTFMKRNELIGAGSRFYRQGCIHLEVTVLHCFSPPLEVSGSPCPTQILAHSPLCHQSPVASTHPQVSPVLSVASALTIGN